MPASSARRECSCATVRRKRWRASCSVTKPAAMAAGTRRASHTTVSHRASRVVLSSGPTEASPRCVSAASSAMSGPEMLIRSETNCVKSIAATYVNGTMAGRAAL